MADWLANGRHALRGDADNLTIVELATRYLKHSKAYTRRDGNCTGEVPTVKAMISYDPLPISWVFIGKPLRIDSA